MPKQPTNPCCWRWQFGVWSCKKDGKPSSHYHDIQFCPICRSILPFAPAPISEELLFKSFDDLNADQIARLLAKYIVREKSKADEESKNPLV